MITETTQEWCDKTLEEINNSIQEQGQSLEIYKTIYENTGNDVALQLEQQCKTNLETLASELAARTSTLNELGQDEINAWSSIASQSYEIYSEEVSKMAPEMQQKIQDITGVIVMGTPNAELAMKQLSYDVIAQLDNSEETRQKAIETLKGYMKGLSDEEQRELLKATGVEDVDKVMEGLKKGDLSEEQGISILKNLYNGLQNSNWTGKLFSTAASIAKSLSDKFSISTSINTNSLPGHKDGLAYVPYDNYVARLHKGERVLTAKENKEYMSGNISNKVSTRNIVNNFYPQQMTDADIDRAKNKIEREWGIQI